MKKLEISIDDIYVNPYSSNAIFGEDNLKQYPTAFWLGTHSKEEKYCNKLSSYVQRIIVNAGNKIPVFMLYMMPNRDIGQYSKGGRRDFDSYKFYINQVIRGIGDDEAIILIESDSFSHLKKLIGTTMFDERVACLSYAINKLSETKCISYLDIGHPSWLKAENVAELLAFLPREKLRGYCINVSNFVPTDICVDYAEHLWRYTHQPCIIDTSRNGGVYPVSHWCNPPEMRLGPVPQMVNSRSVDMYMWIKIPGESDGKHGGLPRAGLWSKFLTKILQED